MKTICPELFKWQRRFAAFIWLHVFRQERSAGPSQHCSTIEIRSKAKRADERKWNTVNLHAMIFIFNRKGFSPNDASSLVSVEEFHPFSVSQNLDFNMSSINMSSIYLAVSIFATAVAILPASSDTPMTHLEALEKVIPRGRDCLVQVLSDGIGSPNPEWGGGDSLQVIRSRAIQDELAQSATCLVLTAEIDGEWLGKGCDVGSGLGKVKYILGLIE